MCKQTNSQIPRIIHSSDYSPPEMYKGKLKRYIPTLGCKKSHRLSKNTNFRASLNPPVPLYCVMLWRFQWGPQFGSHDAERRQSLEQLNA